MGLDGQVGIFGIGVHLPPDVRKNDWWPSETVRRWQEKAASGVLSGRPPEDAALISDGVRTVMQAMLETRDDPFKGAVERRVMGKGVVTSDIEAAACRDALTRAGIEAGQVGLLLTNSQLNDYLCVPNAPVVHRKLGLSSQCLALDTDAACNSFLTQFALAEQMIRGGAVQYALLVQASGFLHLARQEDQHSAWFGDGATAVVVGPVSGNHGILGRAHRTDGSLHDALVTGCPGARWHDGEKLTLYIENHGSARTMLLKVADMGAEVVNEALGRAGVSREQVGFYASHQATSWFRKATQAFIGLPNAKSCDTFAWTGSLGPANIPLVLAMGEREGLLRTDDVVAMYTGGSGITWSSLILRWGR
jgi:3-oxoacyl-[acyl-carrier-protein] synthase-3